MAFVKLDCGILYSTVWVDRDARDVFITALLMAQPGELLTPEPQLEANSLTPTGWEVPPGWYGFVEAAGPGIVRQAGVDDAAGMLALERLGSPDPESRSQQHEGRRLVRVDGGYIVLNFMRYRDRDHTAAARSQRYRDRKKAKRHAVLVGRDGVAPRNVTQEGEEAVSIKQTSTTKVVEERASSQGEIDRYYIACTIALNHGMQENPTLEGEWMPVAASSQVARVTWCEDEIPLGIVEEIILERSKAYRCTSKNRGPRSIKYFDRAVRETWERGQQLASDAKVSEVLSR